jgi:hypothetical protein
MVLQKLRAILKHKGFKLYKRPYELNIVGLRSESTIPNRFDDEIHVFYKTSPIKWNYHVFKATTDPGTFWLKQPMQPQGTAILSEGQFVGAYHLGLHRVCSMQHILSFQVQYSIFYLNEYRIPKILPS